ncbi:MAG TPA: methylmalonyl-CoA mutase family protein, partial [Candidatus Binataceae bacterium]|nr:methylmalonyl-CoA mutase family protein [Candidatus Binataceae bacterium]
MPEEESSIKAAREKYNQAVERALKRGAERRERFATTSGIEIKRLYDPGDVAGFNYMNDLGFPGEYPFTRGVQPTM